MCTLLARFTQVVSDLICRLFVLPFCYYALHDLFVSFFVFSCLRKDICICWLRSVEYDLLRDKRQQVCIYFLLSNLNSITNRSVLIDSSPHRAMLSKVLLSSPHLCIPFSICGLILVSLKQIIPVFKRYSLKCFIRIKSREQNQSGRSWTLRVMTIYGLLLNRPTVP